MSLIIGSLSPPTFFYGGESSGTAPITTASEPAKDFLASLKVAWEGDER